MCRFLAGGIGGGDVGRGILSLLFGVIIGLGALGRVVFVVASGGAVVVAIVVGSYGIGIRVFALRVGGTEWRVIPAFDASALGGLLIVC